ncbi:MAG: S8 family serine peptidase [Caldilineaceae bacterium]
MGFSIHTLLAFFLTAALLGIPQAAPAVGTATSAPAYVEAALLAEDTPALSVIVTAGDSQAAATAVEAAGGSVTADLWLVDAVAASIPAAALSRLANTSGIRSVVANSSVGSAQAPQPATDGWDGYVSRKLVRRPSQAVGGTGLVGLVALDTGGAAALGNNGSLVFFGADGTEMVRHTVLGIGNSAPTGLSAGAGLVIVSAGRNLFAFDSSGTPRWDSRINGNEEYGTGAAIAGGTVYVVVGKRRLHAYHADTGQLRWDTSLAGVKADAVIGAPVVGADGTVYLAYTGDSKNNQRQIDAFNSNGTLKWSFNAGQEQLLASAPLVASNGTVYAIGKQRVYGLNSTGSQRFQYNLPGDLRGTPVVDADGTLFVSVAPDRLIAINADGSRRFEFRTPGNLETGPVLSADGSRVYVAKKEKELYALNAANGAVDWEYTAEGDIVALPAVEANGNVYVGDLLGEVAVLAADGRVVTRFSGFPPVTRSALTTAGGTIFLPNGNSVSSLGKLPKEWNGRPDVKDINEKKVWDLANPFGIDIGADVLHTGDDEVTGRGVAIAVLDSGVYFDDQVKHEMSQQVQKLFLGQADFVERQCDTYQKNKSTYTSGLQYENHCFTGSEDSKDSYGHGTHVAGAIWNNMTDFGTGVYLGVAPDAKILSVRVLDGHGNGTYADAIQGIQYVVQHKDYFGIRVLNMSMSAHPTTPYFVDPLNRAVMEAWAAGITVVAAAGNVGPLAESVTVPGNNPYVITVGAVDSQRTPGYWTGDLLPRWSAAGPTFDGFLKPDVLAPGSQIVSFMYNDHANNSKSAQLVQEHPDYSTNISLFRMNGTSMATAVTSGVVALMLQANPNLTPDQVKYRLMSSALPAVTEETTPIYNLMQQGMGRIWAPAAVLADFPADAAANQGMDIHWDLSHGYGSPEELAGHYQGPAAKLLSDDGESILYYMADADGQVYGLGMADAQSGMWLDAETISNRLPTWSGGEVTLDSGVHWAGGISLGAGLPTWSGGLPTWSGGMALWSGGMPLWSGNTGTWAEGLPTWSGSLNWAGGLPTWSGGLALWSGRLPTWSGGMPLWSGGMAWAGRVPTWSGGLPTWSGGLPTWSGSTGSASLGASKWVDDDDAYETGQKSESPSSPPASSTPVPEPVATAEPTPEQTTNDNETGVLHVSDLDNLSYWESSKKWSGAFVVEISDASGHRQPGAQVTVDIDDPNDRVSGTAHCTTNENGACLIVTSAQQSKKVDRMTLTVQDVALAGYRYDAAANSDPDGDSNGTAITSYLPSPTRTDGPQGQFGSNSVTVAVFNTDGGADGVVPEQMNRIFLPSIGSGK